MGSSKIMRMDKKDDQKYIRIAAYYNNPCEETMEALTPLERVRLPQISFIEDRLRDTMSDKHILRKIKAKYPDINQSTIYELMHFARRVFSTKNYKSKDSARYFHVQMLYRQADRILTKEKLTYKDLAMWEKIMAQAAKYGKLDETDNGIFRPDEVEKPAHYWTSDPSAIGLERISKEDIAKMKAQLISPESRLKIRDYAIDIEHEDVE